MGVIDVDIRSFSYKGEDLAALKNVRFSVERGELVVLTGNSGCGKTTLMRAMNGLITDQYEGELDGRIELLGKSLEEFSSGELARTIGNVFQNPTDQFFTRKATRWPSSARIWACPARSWSKGPSRLSRA